MTVWLHDTAENYRASIINTDPSINTLTDKGVTFMSKRERYFHSNFKARPVQEGDEEDSCLPLGSIILISGSIFLPLHCYWLSAQVDKMQSAKATQRQKVQSH